MKVTKMHGAGNDFLLINNLIEKVPPEEQSELAKTLCPRRLSFGADGLILLDQAQGESDFSMLFYNSDGSAGEMCGNGARCLARFAYEEGVAGEAMRFDTAAGAVEAWRLGEKRYRTKLQLPSVYKQMCLDIQGNKLCGDYVEIGDPGVPHFCLEFPALTATSEHELLHLALTLRHHTAFPKGANINFYAFTSPTELIEKTFERGVEDFTLACGSGSVSVVYALMKSGKVDKSACVSLHVPGGELQVDARWKEGEATEIFLSGPVERVYDTTYSY
jgi:diaminopimelate epimerase